MINSKYYKILGVTKDFSDEEITQKYEELKAKYNSEKFLEGEKGNYAARMLNEIQVAYSEIMSYRKEQSLNGSKAKAFEYVESAIKSGDLNKAQQLLDDFNERSAEWHYLQSVIYYKKNWINESKKQLEIAIEMDGDNQKYKTAYEKLCKQINYNAQHAKNSSNANWNQSGSNGGNNNYSSNYEEPTDMMGGDSCADFCCRMAICNILLNCCCNCR